MDLELEKAHSHCFENRKEILNSKIVGCFHCVKIFNADEINEWVDDSLTAICPKCSIDAVIGDNSGIEINIEFLNMMSKKYF